MQIRKVRKKSFIPLLEEDPPEPNLDEMKRVDWVIPHHYEQFLDYPKTVTLDLGRRCNFSCNYCGPRFF